MGKRGRPGFPQDRVAADRRLASLLPGSKTYLSESITGLFLDLFPPVNYLLITIR
jgi:hypothetical protein